MLGGVPPGMLWSRERDAPSNRPAREGGLAVPLTPVDKIWMDGDLVDWEDARIHVLTHALHYGTGVFEGIRAYETKRGPAVFRLTDHVRRLCRSAHLYQIDLPYSPGAMLAACVDTVRVNGLEACYIRPLVFRGSGEMGLNPLNAPIQVSVAVWSWENYLGEAALDTGATAKISSWKRNDHNVIPPGAKATGGYVNSGPAKVEALKACYGEAIFLNQAGFVTDGTGEKLFAVRGGALY